MSRVIFRSTVAFAARARTISLVERASFVVFTLGGTRCAAPVEVVERVLRVAHDGALRFREQRLSLLDLATPLAQALSTDAHLSKRMPETSALRVLVVNIDDTWYAVPVDAVHEVCTIDAALVMPIPADRAQGNRAGIRAIFRRQDHDVFVLDLVRLLR